MCVCVCVRACEKHVLVSTTKTPIDFGAKKAKGQGQKSRLCKYLFPDDDQLIVSNLKCMYHPLLKKTLIYFVSEWF